MHRFFDKETAFLAYGTDFDMLLRAYTVYIRPLVEHDSVIWSPFTVKDIEAIESVQRRFTKRFIYLFIMISYHVDCLVSVVLHTMNV